MIACHASTGGRERPFWPVTFDVFTFFTNLNLVQIHRLNPTAGVCFHTLNAGVVVAHSPVSCCFYPFYLNTSGLFWGVLIIGCVSVFQYRIGQLYMISKHSHEQSDRGEGVEVVQNEPFEDPEHGQGQFTEKRVYLNRSAILFGVARALPHTFTTRTRIVVVTTSQMFLFLLLINPVVTACFSRLRFSQENILTVDPCSRCV